MALKLPRFARGRVLVVGDAMLDRYWHGEVTRISPEAPVPVVSVERFEDRPGGAANVAVSVRALGAAAVLVGLAAPDEAGTVLRARLSEAGVRFALAETRPEPTIVKLRVLSRNRQMIRLDHERRFGESYAGPLARAAEAMLGEAELLVLSDYGKGTLADPQQLIGMAKRAGKPVLIDPKGPDFDRYGGATLLTPNLAEFEAVAGSCATEGELVEKGSALRARLGLEALLVTRGAKGMTLLRGDRPPAHFPAAAVEVFDVTGAGDTVISTVAAALAAGESLDDAVALSNLAAGLSVGRVGTAAISAGELSAALSPAGARAPRGPVTEDQLLAALAEARESGERVVFTNGCFDILHAGHVRYLERARSLGDRLVVALNDDASVRRLKGAERPLVPLEQRMAVIAAMRAVDWVVAFGGDTPLPLLGKVRPDILVKGGDYRADAVVGADLVRAQGGEVRVLDHAAGVSTTAILNRFRSSEPSF